MIQSSRRHALAIRVLSFLVLLSVACGVCGSCGGNPRRGNQPTEQQQPPAAAPGQSGAAEIGRVVTARALDDNNRAQGITTAFSQDDPIIYVVAEVERIDAGTEAFARWARNGEAFEDSAPITTDREYTDTNLWFAIERSGEAWQPGDYSVTMLIDGRAVATVDFTIE